MNHDASVYTIDITVWRDFSQDISFFFLFFLAPMLSSPSDQRPFRRMKKVTEREKKVNYRGKKEKKKGRKSGSISNILFFSFRLERLAEWLVILVNVTTVPPSSDDVVMMLCQSVVLGRYIHVHVYIYLYAAVHPQTRNT